MKNNKKTLILTARDIAAANSLINFRKLLNDHFNIKIYCENPAYNFLKTKFKCNKFFYSKKNINTIFNENIDVIISGYSSKVIKNFGVDEILVKEGNKRNLLTFIFQDFPGDINFSLKTHPSYYLVVNSLAKKITQKKTNINCIIVGYAFLKEQNKKYLIKKSNKKKILIAGQPINDLDLLKKFYLDLSSVLKIYKDKFNIFYRPHPAENYNFKKIKKIFQENQLEVEYTKNQNLYDDLFNVDLLISIFSNIAIDYSYLNFLLKKKSFSIYFISKKKIKTLFNNSNLYIKMRFVNEINNKSELIKYMSKFNEEKLKSNQNQFEFLQSKINFKNFLKQLNFLIKQNNI